MTGRYQQPNDDNVVWHMHPVQRADRERLHKHRSAVLWFTGLSGAGKSTLASALEQTLYSKGVSTYLLDGDNVRHGLCRDLGFSDDDRRENIRRVGEVARLMLDAGLIVLSALISPHCRERQMVRDMLPVGRFIEVFVDTPLTICQARDPKGLYNQVRRGKLHNFTGIDSIYQPPQQPEIHLNGTQLITELTTRLLELLNERIIINL
ncbi:adenylyl-sulfate kinase [Candidatus Palibaumannia cicadellinicola]|uniref:Adenylyl-sulfate kinase n=1 Tax=Candidatus Palibaumannia cicadellinicola TaxID=186490 RepID=A0A2N4XX56_9GAMM|nr:adenylyl-sulfate kinase [Candidatus Baumannia cicadellinicola]PLK58902.1 adenylyl-sulfate kinase [Candidatus Baumannia cicadellinicola]